MITTAVVRRICGHVEIAPLDPNSRVLYDEQMFQASLYICRDCQWHGVTELPYASARKRAERAWAQFLKEGRR